jgi:membrane protease YdiL (CAAX protease family)
MSWGRAAAAIVAQPLMQLSAARMARRKVRVRQLEPVLAAGQLWVIAGEEYGWRGFAWPRLYRRIGPINATLVMAAMWGLWHLPMFFVPQSLQAQDSVLRFGSAILAWSSLHALLQLDQLSVATAMVYHAATNLSLQVLDVDLEHSSRALMGIYAAVAATAVASMAMRRRRRWS